MRNDPETPEELLAILKEKRSKAEWDLRKDDDPARPNFYGAMARVTTYDHIILLTERLIENQNSTPEEREAREAAKPEPVKIHTSSILKPLGYGIGITLFLFFNIYIGLGICVGTFIGARTHKRISKDRSKELSSEEKERLQPYLDKIEGKK